MVITELAQVGTTGCICGDPGPLFPFNDEGICIVGSMLMTAINARRWPSLGKALLSISFLPLSR